MNKLRSWYIKMRRQLKFAVYDPSNFNELFDVQTSIIRLLSLFFLLLLCFSAVLFFIARYTPIGNVMFPSKKMVDMSLVLEQQVRLDSLDKQVKNQEEYIHHFIQTLNGKIASEKTMVEPEGIYIDPNKINVNPSKSERKLAESVKRKFRTEDKSNGVGQLVHFAAPLKGKVKQKFKLGVHEAVDVVAPNGSYFKACHSGTVLYTDYTIKDGNILIIEHGNGYTSIYKHAQSILKKRGDRVGIGDVLGVIGHADDDGLGTHLHFELWYNQQVVDPERYMHFN